MKKHKKQSKRENSEKLDIMMQELEAKIGSEQNAAPGTCRRIYCV